MKRIACIIFVILTLFVVDCRVFAEKSAEKSENEFVNNVIEDAGLDRLKDDLPNVDGYNIDIENPTSILQTNPLNVLSTLWTTIKIKAVAPLKLLIALIAVILLASLIESMGDVATTPATARVFEVICVLASVAILSDSVCGIIEEAAQSISNGSTFMTNFAPIFAGIVATSGSISSAGCYSVLVLTVAQFAMTISSNVMMPMLSLCMALGIVDAINPAISLSRLLKGIVKVVTWGLGLLMTVFVGLLSIQSIVGASADTVTIKAGKYLVSNLIPIVGGAVSDAYTTVRGSLGLLRGGVGTFGIIAIVITLLPPIVSVGLYYCAMQVASAIADIFGVKQLSTLFKNIASVISLAFGIMICFSLMVIISTTIIMLVGLDTI